MPHSESYSQIIKFFDLLHSTKIKQRKQCSSLLDILDFLIPHFYMKRLSETFYNLNINTALHSRAGKKRFFNQPNITMELLCVEKGKLDVDPRRDDDAFLMSSYRCMLRPTCMFMDRMIAPINVHSISWKLFTKHDSKNFFP